MKHALKLSRLVGKEFLYKQNNIIIKDYYPVTEQNELKIITDGTPITIKEDSIDLFIDQLLPVEPEHTEAVATVNKQVVDGTINLMSTLQQTLLESIAMVKDNPDFIKQANTINSSVNSLVGLTKIQLRLAQMNAGKK